MSDRLAATTGARTRDARTVAGDRAGSFPAYLAAPLWALQGLIWVAAPKVQDRVAPFHITNVVLFELFWLSIAGAVAFSAASAGRIPATIAAPTSRLNQWTRVLAKVALYLATGAVVCIACAPLPLVQSIALTAMTNLLNAALVVLASSLTLAAVLSRRADGGSSMVKTMTTGLAAVTIAMLVGIMASGTQSVAGLYFAVAVAVLSGVAWLTWGMVAAATVHPN
jgi:hypothetical protein